MLHPPIEIATQSRHWRNSSPIRKSPKAVILKRDYSSVIKINAGSKVRIISALGLTKRALVALGLWGIT